MDRRTAGTPVPARSANRSARRWAFRILLPLAILSAGYGLYRVLPHKAVMVQALHPARGTVRDVVSSSVAGEVTPELHATVRAEIGGTVVAVRHKAGARVKKGAALVELEDADLRARLGQAQAARSATEGQLQQARARLDTLRHQAERARVLLAKGAGTAQLSEDADAAVREATQAVRAAEGQLQQAEATGLSARIAAGHARIEAPFDGLLTDVFANLGENLVPAAPVVQIIDDSRLHVDATIDEADAAKVHVGQEAELNLDALPGHAIKGRVARVDPAVKRDLKGARTLAVEVEVSDVQKALAVGLLPGMSANVEIVVAEKQNVLYLPSNVIVGRGVQRSVYLLHKEGRYFRISKTDVQIGLSNWDKSEVLSGVAPDAMVVKSLNVKGVEDGALAEIGSIASSDRESP